jgi:hypothetical protein
MARAVALKSKLAPGPKPSPLLYCPFCRAARADGASLYKHCDNAHEGQIPLVVCTSTRADYTAAVEMLRKLGLKVTTIGSSR